MIYNSQYIHIQYYTCEQAHRLSLVYSLSRRGPLYTSKKTIYLSVWWSSQTSHSPSSFSSINLILSLKKISWFN